MAEAGSSKLDLTPRDQEIVIAALQCLKGGEIQVSDTVFTSSPTSTLKDFLVLLLALQLVSHRNAHY